jgi:hypothetical protein
LNDRIIRRSAPQPYVLFNQPSRLKTEQYDVDLFQELLLGTSGGLVAGV